MVQIYFHSSVQTLRFDNAFELGGSSEAKAFFTEMRYLTKLLFHIPQNKNGMVERKYKHLLETSRALIFQSNLPIKYWGECVLTATYIINRIPCSDLGNISPFEKLHGLSPSYEHPKSFGCLCYATTPKPGRDIFKSRAIKYVFMGYPCGKKGYKLLNLTNHSVVFSWDVVFHEHIFPYSSSSSSDLLVPPIPFVDCVSSLSTHSSSFTPCPTLFAPSTSSTLPSPSPQTSFPSPEPSSPLWEL